MERLETPNGPIWVRWVNKDRIVIESGANGACDTEDFVVRGVPYSFRFYLNRIDGTMVFEEQPFTNRLDGKKSSTTWPDGAYYTWSATKPAIRKMHEIIRKAVMQWIDTPEAQESLRQSELEKARAELSAIPRKRQELVEAREKINAELAELDQKEVEAQQAFGDLS